MAVRNNHVLPPILTVDDLKQEIKLAELEGRKPPSPRRANLKELSYGLFPDPNDIPVCRPHIPNLTAIESLSAWLLYQSERVRLEVLDYLDAPTDDQFLRVLAIIDAKFIPEPKDKTLTQLIKNALPATKIELYEMARMVHESKRPEAAVRAILRNLVKRGEIEAKEETYSLIEGRQENTKRRKKVNT